MTFGLDEFGLEIKTIDTIKTEMRDKFRSVMGQGINVDERALLGQIIGVTSEREALVWEVLEQIYNSQYPDTAEGVPLDNVASITGTIRKDPTKSIGIATLIGTAGINVPALSVVSVLGNSSSRFLTDTAALILPGTDEIQTVAFLQVPDGGTFQLGFGAETTASLDETAVAGDVEAALEALDGIDDVTVTGSFAAGFVITFLGSNGLSPQPLITIVVNTLTDTEEGTVTTDGTDVDGEYFLMQEAGGSVAFWIDEDDSGTTIPAGAAAADRAVEITTIAAADSASVRATKVAAVMLADAAFSSASAIGAIISYVVSAAGALVDGADGDTGWAFATTTQGRSAGDLTITPTETTPGVFPQVDVGVTAETAGEVAAPAGSLTVIETPITGWSSVTNALDIDVGTDVEVDQPFKLRRLAEIAIAGKATLEAIRSAMLAISDVTEAVVFQNKTSIIDSEGRPPKSVDIVVENGDDAVIAAEIFDVVAAGIETIGTETEILFDSQGFSQTIKFSRPTDVPMSLEVALAVNPALYPADGDLQVENAILAYGAALGIGDDVIVVPQLICSFANIPGILDAAIKLGAAAIPADGTDTVVATDDTGDLLLTTGSPHGLLVANRVKFTTTGTLPPGLSPGVVYFIVAVPGASTLKVSLLRGGDPIGFSGSGSGVHTVSFGGLDNNMLIFARELAKFDSSRITVTS